MVALQRDMFSQAEAVMTDGCGLMLKMNDDSFLLFCLLQLAFWLSRVSIIKPINKFSGFLTFVVLLDSSFPVDDSPPKILKLTCLSFLR